jgi:hypothetical protein
VIARRPGSLAIALAGCGWLGPKVALADGAVSFEVREQLAAAMLPAHHYDVTGSCATGTGLAPASVYAQPVSARGNAFGAGVGGRVGYRIASARQGDGNSTWWGLRLGAGLDLDLLYGHVDTGIGDLSGTLCARIKSDGVQPSFQGSSVFLAQISAFVGGEVGLGKLGDDSSWHGVVLGAGLAPAIAVFKPWVSDVEVDGGLLGLELTVDFATLTAGAPREAGKRVAIFLLLPSHDDGPLVVTASFGLVSF